MPRRGVIALIVTTVALVLLLSFKTPSQPAIASFGAGSAAGPVGVGQGAVVTPAPADPNQALPSTDPGAQAGSGAQTSTTTQASPTAGPGSAAPTRGPASAKGPVTGPVVATPFGYVQVQVTVSGGKIVDVQALQLPSDRRRSQMISQYVGPVLRQEALQAQSAQIDLVSGATYTSQGYAQSLQAALDLAHA